MVNYLSAALVRLDRSYRCPYVSEVVEQTEAKQGKIMYARLYWAFADTHAQDFDLFEDSDANWRRHEERASSSC